MPTGLEALFRKLLSCIDALNSWVEAPRSFEASPGRAEPEPEPELSWPEMAMVDNFVDLMPTDEVRCDPRCLMRLGLLVAVKLSMVSESKEYELETEPGPEHEHELEPELCFIVQSGLPLLLSHDVTTGLVVLFG